MDDPLNPFSRRKTQQGQVQGESVSPPPLRRIPPANSDTLRSLISPPLTVIGFLIKGGLVGGHPSVRPDFKVQVRCSDASFVFGSRFYDWLEAPSFRFLPFALPLEAAALFLHHPSDSLLPSRLRQSFASSSKTELVLAFRLTSLWPRVLVTGEIRLLVCSLCPSWI